MNYEIDPILREKAENILRTKSEFVGLPYLKSKVKRALDLMVTVPSSPLAASISGVGGTLIYLDDGHWPYVDVGLKSDCKFNKEVKFWKLRTMIPNARSFEDEVVGDETLLEYKRSGHEDPRITTIGKVFRSLNLDEVPQVLGALNGNISLVGPRMISLTEWNRIIYPNSDIEPYSGFINLLNEGMKFGITGMYVVMRNNFDLTVKDRVCLEVMYGERASLSADLKIIIKSIPQIFNSTG